MGKIACSLCGGEIVLDPATGRGKCLNCGLVYEEGTLKKMVLGETASNQPPLTEQAVQQPCAVPCSTTSMPTRSNGEQNTPKGQQEPQQAGNPHPEETGEDVDIRSALANWKTSVVWSIAGFLAYLALNYWATHYTPITYMPVYAIGFLSICVYYAFVVYPSFFGNDPYVKSPGAISFWNFFFGGVVFGPLWNRNLTKRNRGCSYIVSGVLSTLSLALSLLFCLSFCSQAYASVFDRISQGGHVNDTKTAWIPEAIYSNAAGKENEYWDIFNNYACWAVSELADTSYDVAHEYICNECDTETFTAPITNSDVFEELEAHATNKPSAREQKLVACDEDQSHAYGYRTIVNVDDNLSYEVRLVKLFLHPDTTPEAATQHKDPAPWVVMISEID